MDRETEHRLTELESRVDAVEGKVDSWNSFIKDTVTNIVLWLLKSAIIGAILGWCLPGPVRDRLLDWMSK